MKQKTPTIEIVPADGDEPLPVQIIQDAIVKIAAGMRAMNETRLTRKAIVVLINHTSKVPMRDIEYVLNNLAALEETWLTKKIVKP